MSIHWRELKVWRKAHELVLLIHESVKTFPKSEMYSLTDQLKRAAYSIPANLVEGQSRNTTKEYLSFLYNSRGSLEELRYFLLLACDLHFLDSDSYQNLEDKSREVSLMLNAMIKTLRSKL